MNALDSVGTRPFSSHPIWYSGSKSIFVVLGLIILGVLYGFGPEFIPSSGMQQFFLGLAHCYSENLPLLRCDAVAQPDGYTTVFGLPYVLPVAMLERMGVPLLHAGRIVEFAYLAIAFAGCLALFRSFGVRLFIAFTASFVFFASPIVFAQDGYGPLRLGFALLPFYGWIDLVIARQLASRKKEGLVLFCCLALIALALVRSFALFMDGYSFVMGLVLSAALLFPLIHQLTSRRNLFRIVLIGLLFLFSTLAAYIAYSSYVGGMVEGSVMPIDFFRGQGVDLYALAVPSWMQWFAEWFNIRHSLNGWMTYSDGPNVTYVYLGWSLILLLVFAIFTFFIGCVQREQKIQLGVLLLLFMGSLGLALGPSLKVADFREDPPPGRFIEFSDYLMPESQATLSLGTAWLYQKLPGIRNMRAVYRWMLLVKLSILLIAALMLDRLMSQPRLQFVSILFLLVIVIELLPNIPHRIEYSQRQFNQYKAFERDILASFEDIDIKGSKVLLQPAIVEEGWNHFTANFICPVAQLRCFNLGGDKSLMQARLTWPLEVRELSRSRWHIGNLQTLLLSGDVDEILIPLFSLRGAAYRWPPSPESLDNTLQAALELASQVGVETIRHGWFLRLSNEVPIAELVQNKVNSELAFEVSSWGPSEGSFDEGFNVQSDGRSSFWVLFSDDSSPDERMILVLDGLDLETYNDSKVLSGRLPNAEDLERFPPGRYSLTIRDRVTNEITLLGEFIVVRP